MSDFVIGLIPDYGLFVIFGTVALACLAIPLPSSMLVLASGAFAATGDLTLWQVIAVSFLGFVVGDQVAYRLAAGVGPRLLGWMRGKPKLAVALDKGQHLLDSKGKMAVFLSHTILSPTCPYVSYLSGAGGMKWAAFSGVATIGAAVWAGAYVMLGYVFATQLTQVASVLSRFIGIVLALMLIAWSVVWLKDRWRKFVQEHEG